MTTSPKTVQTSTPEQSRHVAFLASVRWNSAGRPQDVRAPRARAGPYLT